MQAECVRLERSSCIATVVLDRPQVRNALDEAAVKELTRRLGELDADPSVRVVVLASEGSSFSAGADLRAMHRMGVARHEENLADTRRFVKMLHILSSLSKATVASVQGPAIAGGVGLVACCDIALASERAFFRLSEVRLGLVPAMVGPYLVEALGARIARRLMLTGERFDARQAADWGLIHEVHPHDQLPEATIAVAGQLSRGAPGALSCCKRLVREIVNSPLDRKLRERTAEVLAERRSSLEARSGVQSFLRKSRPPWTVPGSGEEGQCQQ